MELSSKLNKKFIGILAAFVILACSPEDPGSGNGLSDSNLDPSFSITEVPGAVNRYTLKANSNNYITSKWDIGEGPFLDKQEIEIYLPDAGTYTLTHQAIGKGGEAFTSTQELVVAESDPVAGNLLRGSKFETEEDFAEWTILNISDSGASWNYTPGFITVTGGGWNQQGVYQAVEVQANKDYRIDMRVWGSGAVNTWFEVYVSKTPPVQNNDYTGDIRMQLNTWAGCATAPFDGKLSAVGCGGSGNIVRFDEAGTVYFIVKSGGESLGETGISIDNVEFRGVQ